jgi:hypothetical protein
MAAGVADHVWTLNEIAGAAQLKTDPLPALEWVAPLPEAQRHGRLKDRDLGPPPPAKPPPTTENHPHTAKAPPIARSAALRVTTSGIPALRAGPR